MLGIEVFSQPSESGESSDINGCLQADLSRLKVWNIMPTSRQPLKAMAFSMQAA
jgi:hypothetical protein